MFRSRRRLRTPRVPTAKSNRPARWARHTRSVRTSAGRKKRRGYVSEARVYVSSFVLGEGRGHVKGSV